MGFYGGPDISLAIVEVCVAREERKVLWNGKAEGHPAAVIEALRSCQPELVHARLETGPMSEWIGERRLIEAGFPAAYLKSRHVKAALGAMTVKADRNDAQGLAQIVRTSGSG